MKQVHTSSSTSKNCSDIVLCITTLSVVPLSLLNPNLSCSSIVIISSVYTCYCLAACAIRLIVRLLLHFVAFGSPFNVVIAMSLKSLGHSPVSYC